MESGTTGHDEIMTLSPEEILVKGSGDKLTVESSELSKPMVIRGVIKKQHADNCA
jgi:hypothetical protein